MKIVKVKIRRGDRSKGEDMMVYPAGYNAEEVDSYGFGPSVLNGTGGYSGGIGRGFAEESCLIVLEDEVADRYAQDPDMEIIDEAAADSLSEQWRIAKHETEIVIREPETVRYLQDKKAKGAERVADGKGVISEYTLTAEELKILDPDDPTPGINKRLRPYKMVIEEMGHTLTAKTGGQAKGA